MSFEFPDELTITVTQDHIDRGTYSNPRCAMNLAVRDALRELGLPEARVFVGYSNDMRNCDILASEDGYGEGHEWPNISHPDVRYTTHDGIPSNGEPARESTAVTFFLKFDQYAMHKDEPDYDAEHWPAPAPATFTFTKVMS